MHHSMTGFASSQGQHGPHTWTWDIRSVNAKGLDIKVRTPDWIPNLEQALKAQLAKRVARGNVTVNLRIQRSEASGGLALNEAATEQALLALAQIEDRAMFHGITLAPSKAADLLSIRGVLEADVQQDDTEALSNHLAQDFTAVAEAFVQMRQTEGQALIGILSDHFDQIEALVDQAATQLEARTDAVKEALNQQLARVLDADLAIDPQRVAQELALIAVKGDVTEEIDRLRAHIKAARDLIASDAPAGRKLDFLAQEFNREANTLCSKSQNVELTATGLELKAVIEQMREQVQNLE
ncbi:YicC/YloC family endoribonuclease [Pseudooceanicola sp. MF1-13]|uniref:YicC/YloC family endoribonuclease n=1 Tax=Pseudooceanicola sp. MF1-13 TaxID=3379095 RepID=UPI0038926A63